MMNQQPLKIFIVEDHDLVRQSLSMLMSRRHDFEVVGEASTAAEALDKLQEVDADVLIVDVHLPDQSGIEVSREIRARNPKIRVLLLTTHGDDRAVIGSVIAGACGYLRKEIRSQETIEAIRKAGRGQSLLEPWVTRRVLERVRAGVEEDEGSQLTSVEHQILELIAQGKTDQEIAAAVSLNEGAVKGHITALHGKLEVTRRTQSVAYSVTWRTRQRTG